MHEHHAPTTVSKRFEAVLEETMGAFTTCTSKIEQVNIISDRKFLKAKKTNPINIARRKEVLGRLYIMDIPIKRNGLQTASIERRPEQRKNRIKF